MLLQKKSINFQFIFFGSLLQNTWLGPGRYDVEVGGFSSKSVENAASGPGWARAHEVSRMAALPHLLYKEQWQQKKLLVCKFQNLFCQLENVMSVKAYICSH